nr:MerR family DNA-binding transcriptional regulator [Motilibacter peucedani]
MTPLRSSQVASAAGVNVQTLRHYERRGLLAEPRRSLGDHWLSHSSSPSRPCVRSCSVAVRAGAPHRLRPATVSVSHRPTWGCRSLRRRAADP